MQKDEVLDALAAQGANIAQFASFNPDTTPRFIRIRGLESGARADVAQAVELLLKRGSSVNIRTFLPDKPGSLFHYGIKNAEEAISLLRTRAGEGLFTILNETIAVDDGGFSGVLFGMRMDGAPNDIPRCVEKPGCMALPRPLGMDLIYAVYQFFFHTPFSMQHRVEFSVHPDPVGLIGEQQVIWQADRYPRSAMPRRAPDILWPNRYSEAMGDKAFGLLIAHLLGLPVPRTTVFGRLIPLFTFGAEVKGNEPVWVRTAPKIQTPGKYQTRRGWADPFEIMQRDDPKGEDIASILVMDGVPAQFSGSASASTSGKLLIEGCKGYGDNFMLGTVQPEQLPQHVVGEIAFVYDTLRTLLGKGVRFEWVYDGTRVWIVQLHRGLSGVSSKDVIYPGRPKRWITFDFNPGDLEKVRNLAKELKEKDIGIIMRGNFSTLSHVGDTLREAKIPSYRAEKK